MHRTFWIALTLIALTLPQNLRAQVVIEPQPVSISPQAVTVPPTSHDAVHSVSELNSLYRSGNWATLQSRVRGLLALAQGQQHPPHYDFINNYIVVVWIGVDTFGNSGLYRLLVHQPDPAPYKLNLPGVGIANGSPQLYEVFVSDSPNGKLVSTYTSAEEVNPILTDFPTVAAKVLPTLFGVIAGTLPAPAAKMATGDIAVVANRLYLSAATVPLPAKRATISVSSTARDAVTFQQFDRLVDEVAATPTFQAAACASTLAASDRTQLKLRIRLPASTCEPQSGQNYPASACLRSLNEILDAELATISAASSCGSDTESKAIGAVDNAFRELVSTSLLTTVKSDITLKNRPLGRFSFGLMEAVALWAKLDDPRVKLTDDGTLVADTLPRLLTAVTFNGAFRGYDEDALTATPPEQWRWFGGAAIAPDFGAVGGISYMPVRGLAFNVGAGVLFTKSADAAEIGAAPKDARDPFRIGVARIIFVGASYVFK